MSTGSHKTGGAPLVVGEPIASVAVESPVEPSEIALPFIEQVTGPQKGRTIELSGQKLSIGRSDENDIVVQAEAVSRVHAHLMQSEGAWFIRDNKSKNGVQVNGTAVNEAWLQSGDIVQVGSFVFRFREPNVPLAVRQEPEVPLAAVPGMEEGVAAEAVSNTKKKPNRRLMIYGVVGLLLAFLYVNYSTPDGAPKDAPPKAASAGADTKAAADDVQNEISNIDKRIADITQNGQDPNGELDALKDRKLTLQKQLSTLSRAFDAAKEPNMMEGNPKKTSVVSIEDPSLKQAEQEMMKLDWSNSSLREAEQFFRKGQREYLAGNLQRAIDSFQTSLSFFRGHKLAEKYLRLAVYEVEALAKKHMEMGVQYFESLQYQRAMYHFGETVALMQHRPQEAIVVEAERYVALCKRRLQAAELFP